jgi:formylglycine-generating enzyme required for sulfatase activity
MVDVRADAEPKLQILLIERDPIDAAVLAQLRGSSRHSAIFTIIAAIALAAALSPWQPRPAKSAEPTPMGMARGIGRDCDDCPQMAAVPAGTFRMGSPKGEVGRSDEEGPQHDVTIAEPFAVGQYEVTFDEWDACVKGGGCNGYKPSDQGWGRGRRPVINVSWNDAQAYVAWLSKETGKTYRLLSEAEWEYVARAGSTTAYWWGNDFGRYPAYCLPCGHQWERKGTTPVGSFAANSFWLYDTAGNVWEWVEDCWHGSYWGAPDDGSAWTSGALCPRVMRGGSSGGPWGEVRSAVRRWGSPSFRNNNVGFRVARRLR